MPRYSVEKGTSSKPKGNINVRENALLHWFLSHYFKHFKLLIFCWPWPLRSLAVKVLLARKLQISRIPSCGGESQDDDVIHPQVGVSECFFPQGYSTTVRVRLVSHFDAAWYLFHFHIEFNTARRKKWRKDWKTICSSEAHIKVRSFWCLVCNSLTHLLRFCCW